MTDKKSHDEFILAHSKNKVNVMFNDSAILDAGINFHGNEDLKEKAKRFIKFKKTGIYVWGLCILTLFTPLRFLVIGGLIYWAMKHFVYSTLKSYIVDEMKRSEKFYNQAIDDKLVHLEYS